MIKLVTVTFIMITTSTAFPHRHSQSRSNSPDLSYQKFHLRDEIHGTQYLKVESGTNFLNLVQNSEHFDPEESSEKSRMSDITWFTGNFFTELDEFAPNFFSSEDKGNLISEKFSLWLKSQKNPRHLLSR